MKKCVKGIIVFVVCCILGIGMAFEICEEFPDYMFCFIGLWTAAFLLILGLGIKIEVKACDSSFASRFKNYNAEYIISLIVLSVIMISMFKNPVNMIVERLSPNLPVTITVEEAGDIIIIDDGTEASLFNDILQGEMSGSWENGGNIIASSDSFSALRFNASAQYNRHITFARTSNGAVLCVRCGSEVQVINLESDEDEELTTNFYPFSEMKKPLFLKCFLYLLIFAIIFLGLLLGLNALCYSFSVTQGFLLKEHNEKNWWSILLFVYPYSVFQSVMGMSYGGEYGDQLYYWISLVKDGRVNLKYISTWIFPTRGYWGNVFPTIALLLGEKIGVKPIYVYLLFLSIAIAVLFGNLLPRVYFIFSQRKASRFAVATSFLLFLLFWNGMITCVLSDVFALVFFVASCVNVFEFKNKGRLWTAIKAGTYIAITCSYRMTYITAYMGGLLVGVIYLCYKWWGDKHKSIDRNEVVYYGKGLVLAIVAFMLVSLPQARINYYNEHIGVLPYDEAGSWSFPGQLQDTSLTVYGANYTLRQSYIWYPFQETDEQQLSMKNQIYGSVDEYLSITQLLDVYASSPMDTIVFLLKKFFIAFDEKTSYVYPLSSIKWRDSRGVLFSFENYLVMAVALFLLFFCSGKYKKERLFFLFLLVSVAFPQMFTHIEWRYFFPLYLFVYYMVSYEFLSELVVHNEKRYIASNSKLYPVLAFYILIAFVINFTISA